MLRLGAAGRIPGWTDYPTRQKLPASISPEPLDVSASLAAVKSASYCAFRRGFSYILRKDAKTAFYIGIRMARMLFLAELSIILKLYLNFLLTKQSPVQPVQFRAAEIEFRLVSIR